MSKKIYSSAAVLAAPLITTQIYADRVELNVVPGKRASLGSAQQWMQALSSLKSARIRSDRNTGSTSPEAKWVGSTLYVTAVIGSDNKLHVPGKRFTIRQSAALSNWLEAQKTQRESGPAETCLLYTSPSPRDRTRSRMPSSA